MKVKNIFFLILLTSPGFWQVLFQPQAFFSQVIQFPKYATQTIKSKLQSTEYATRLQEIRWGGRALHREDFVSKALYFRHIIVINEIFEFIQNASPKFFFLAGDGSNFTPRRIEPISSILFPFWIIGVITLINKKSIKAGLLFLVFSFIGYISGHKNLVFLFPLFLLQIYICSVGVSRFGKKTHAVIGVYGIYISLMNLWLNI